MVSSMIGSGLILSLLAVLYQKKAQSGQITVIGDCEQNRKHSGLQRNNGGSPVRHRIFPACAAGCP
ncbi:hypothetical protein LR61_15890 [Morganella morganii]|nr:hypothetical protein LR61_15890 [Morganella morganii]